MNSSFQESETVAINAELQQLLVDIRFIDNEIRNSLLSEPPQTKKTLNEKISKKEILQKLYYDKISIRNSLNSQNTLNKPIHSNIDIQNKHVSLAQIDPRNFPKFHPEAEGFEIHEFIDTMESLSLANEISQELLTKLILKLVTLSDTITLQWLSENVSTLSWNACKETLVKHYYSQLTERKYNIIFNNFKKCNSETITHMSDRFKSTVIKAKLFIDSISVRDKYLSILPYSIRQQVLIKSLEVNTFNELMALAINVDTLSTSINLLSNNETHQQVGRVSPHKDAKADICNYCKKYGHHISDCRNLAKNHPESKALNTSLHNSSYANTEDKNYHYSKPANSNFAKNHQNNYQNNYSNNTNSQSKTTNQTYHKQKSNDSNHNINQLQKQKSINQISAYNSEDTTSELQISHGHFCQLFTDNKQNLSKNETELFIFPVIIESHHVEACLDSGAEISVISKSVVQKLNLKTRNSKHTLKLATANHMTDISQETYPLNIQWGNKNFTHKFVVADLALGNICLFGVDIFKKLNLYIENTPTITFQNESNSFKHEQMNDRNNENSVDEYDMNIQSMITQNLQSHLAENEKTKNNFCSLEYAEVQLQLMDNEPSWINQYKLNPEKHTFINKTVQQWLSDGIITFAEQGTVWNSPLIVVKKINENDGTVKLRACLDPRHINLKLKDDKYPIPKLRDILNAATGNSIFSSIDLASSFHQLPVKKDDQKITAFTWNNVHYKFCGAPFGLKILTSIFQRIMMRLFHDLSFVQIYVDDILIMSNSHEEHLIQLQEVIKRLTNANLTINQKKCRFAYFKLNILGHSISSKGIEIDKHKITNVLNFPIPKTTKDLQSFLGLMNFFRDFIPNFSKISKKFNLIQNSKQIHIQWNHEYQQCFDELKECLFKAPILKTPSDNLQYVIQTDASAYAIGCILMQVPEGKILPINNNTCSYIKFASRSLTESEQNYSASKRELLAIIFGLKKFTEYIFGKQFTILCDHKPLSYFTTQDNLGEIYETWLNTLLKFNFTIQYVPGSLNILPDSLSRLYPDECIQKDKSISFINNISQEMTTKEEKIALALGKQIPTVDERLNLLEKFHSVTHCGYQGLFKLLFKNNFYWHGMKNDCQNFCLQCMNCQRNTIVKTGYDPQTSISASLPMDHIAVDTIGPFPISSNGYNYVLIAVDIFTRFVFLKALKDKTAQSVASSLYEIFANFGHPKIMQTDNGTEYINQVINELTKLYNFQHRKTSPYYPQANGIVERSVRETVELLKKRLEGENDNWSFLLPNVQISLNQRISTLHNSTPFSLMFARNLNSFSNFSATIQSSLTPEQFQERYKFITEIVYPSIVLKTNDTLKKRNNNWNKCKKLSSDLPIGTVVMVKQAKQFNKLESAYIGPYRIVHVARGHAYKLADAVGAILPRNFKKQQLKVVLSNELTTRNYVEAIIGHRTNEQGNTEYLVHWFGYPIDESTWEPASSFDDPSVISAYRNSVGSDVNNSDK